MIPAIKSEFRKLLTVRTTYFIVGGVSALVIFFAFYIVGWRAAEQKILDDPTVVTSNVTGILTSLPLLIGAVVAILLMTHEYRYNTILHTMTATNNRLKVLAAKFLVTSVYALLFTAVVTLLTILFMYLGIAANHHTLVAQQIHYRDFVWHVLFYGWAYIISALLLAALLRNQIAAIVSIFAIPIAEQLFGLLLKTNSVYMPYMSLGQVLGGSDITHGSLSPARGAVVFGMYLLIGWVVACILFVKRDAN